MSIGFRKSLFGFHCDDVMQYIKQSQQNFATMQKTLSDQVEALANDLALSNNACQALTAEKEELTERLAQFHDKYEEIDRLSENIGKLYLVAQANAKAIMENANESAELSRKSVDRNLSAVSQAHSSLDELKKILLATTQDFAGEIDSLIESLDETRVKIMQAQSDNEEHLQQFEQIYESIVK